MEKDANIQPMQSDFEQIKKVTEKGKEYWSARELATALGYSTWQKFNRVLNKALKVAQDRGMEMSEHFNQVVEMVKLGSGTFREVDNFHLSRIVCLIIAENADNKKPQVQAARIYFKEKTSAFELVENQNTSHILIYKTHQGESRVEVIFNGQTFWLTQKRMSDLYGVDVSTINYHLGEIYETGELKEDATIRKLPIVQMEGNREVNRTQLLYNLDAIIAVGYRVNSYQAVTHQTAAEIIYARADADMPHMGLTTWKNAPDGRVQRSDTIVAKNYLSDKEVSELNQISNAFLDLAENRADRQLITTMAEWKEQLERFMAMYSYEVLEDAGKVTAEEAKEKAYGEYDKFRLIQDREYLSDFDKEVRNWKELGMFEED